jgi:hypothetical protein
MLNEQTTFSKVRDTSFVLLLTSRNEYHENTNLLNGRLYQPDLWPGRDYKKGTVLLIKILKF